MTDRGSAMQQVIQDLDNALLHLDEAKDKGEIKPEYFLVFKTLLDDIIR
jgi:hypothetical protein